MKSERQQDPQLITQLNEDLGLSSCTFCALVSLATCSLANSPPLKPLLCLPFRCQLPERFYFPNMAVYPLVNLELSSAEPTQLLLILFYYL